MMYLDREWKRTRVFGNTYIQKSNRNPKRTKYRNMLGPTFKNAVTLNTNTFEIQVFHHVCVY